ncbi:hypothetical protein BJV78DRAFT_688132 [Lactifluus subvellereus]|nr:hypothetical protein BJV78DRAFT_688132 [Lactifluus subvellereus]
MDLLNLARTSKALRQVLMSRKSISVWIAARRAAGATTPPEPPEDMSEPSWAQLLFGPAVCSQCSTKNIHRVDFALRRRLCIVCRKRNLVFSIKFRSQCPGLKESVMDLLPYTKIGGWAHGHASNSRFYWKPDLYEIGKRSAELEEDVDAGKPGAQKRLKSFRAERILLVDSIIQGCSEFEKWVKAEAEAQAHNAHERRCQRREALKIRMLALGYELADINFMGMHAVPGSNVDKPLTDDAWRRIRAKVDTKLSHARQARLFAARRRRASEYKGKAEHCYSNLLSQVLPVQRLCLPALSQVTELACFKDFLDPNKDVQPADWEHAVDQLPQSLSEWMSEHRDQYTSLLPSHAQGARGKAMTIRLMSDPSIDSWRHEAMANFAGPLDLATSVFRETNSEMILIGRDICYAWGVKGPRLEYSARGAEAVNALLRVLQLDPTSTTVSTLEGLSIQFICACCQQDRYLSWRSCVLHFVESSETDHSYPQWQMVGPDYAASSSTRGERPGNNDGYPPPRIETWLCNHCGDYLEPDLLDLGSRADIVQHLRDEHDVDDPVVDVDLFSYPIFECFLGSTEL